MRELPPVSRRGNRRARGNISQRQIQGHSLADFDRRFPPVALYGRSRGDHSGSPLRHCHRIPRLNWVFRAFYGQYYQPPPIVPTTGALYEIAADQGVTFAPIYGERDNEYQFGVTIPYRGWALDVDSFNTQAENWLDHSNIGESNLFWPITWYEARIQSWELTLRSPRLWNRGQFHLAYSNQIAQAEGPITGELCRHLPRSCRPAGRCRRAGTCRRSTAVPRPG